VVDARERQREIHSHHDEVRAWINSIDSFRGEVADLDIHFIRSTLQKVAERLATADAHLKRAAHAPEEDPLAKTREGIPVLLRRLDLLLQEIRKLKPALEDEGKSGDLVWAYVRDALPHLRAMQDYLRGTKRYPPG
jgi:hypothetical protein